LTNDFYERDTAKGTNGHEMRWGENLGAPRVSDIDYGYPRRI
jgi:hypothetical protein